MLQCKPKKPTVLPSERFRWLPAAALLLLQALLPQLALLLLLLLLLRLEAALSPVLLSLNNRRILCPWRTPTFAVSSNYGTPTWNKPDWRTVAFISGKPTMSRTLPGCLKIPWEPLDRPISEDGKPVKSRVWQISVRTLPTLMLSIWARGIPVKSRLWPVRLKERPVSCPVIWVPGILPKWRHWTVPLKEPPCLMLPWSGILPVSLLFKVSLLEPPVSIKICPVGKSTKSKMPEPFSPMLPISIIPVPWIPGTCPTSPAWMTCLPVPPLHPPYWKDGIPRKSPV